MAAAQIFNRRIPYAEGRFAQIVVWQLPAPLAGSTHSYKYRLAYVVDEACVLRYDNEAGKGDHTHRGAIQARYAFISLAQLLADFESDIERWNRENRNHENHSYENRSYENHSH
ncbi:MAG: DUF6516 family protein [Pseudomonadales bacterium]|jgi:hypothetical protein|nr:DUF6516 family protein [Pseudomonadales bacterium]